MKIGTRVKLTPVVRADAYLARGIGDRTGTITTATADWVTIDFDGLDALVGLPASNVECVTLSNWDQTNAPGSLGG